MADEVKNTHESYDYSEDLIQVRNKLVVEHTAFLDNEMQVIKKDIERFIGYFKGSRYSGVYDVCMEPFNKHALDVLAGIYGVTEITSSYKSYISITVKFGINISDEIAKYKAEIAKSEAAIERLMNMRKV